jgi:flagellar motility protein MotE (MotC chaperone)/sporulation protein YlmC with PRC-barrel domain
MNNASRVYVARMTGLAVFDPNGDQVGRVRDAVARAREGAKPPRVVGLVAELPMRRRIFIPIGRVVSIDADAVVLSTGTVSLRRFEKRAGELLVLEDLLDRQVTISSDGTAAAVVDVAMESDRAGDWLLSRVAVREHASRLGRRGHLHQLEWNEVAGLVGTPDVQGTASLLAVLEDMRPADLANVLQDLPEARRNEVAAALDDERLADVLEELPEHDQVGILAALDRERAADVLEEMQPDDAADLLAELSKPERDELLNLMEPGEATPVRALLAYLPGTAGSLMTPEPVILTPDASVAEALARVREQQLSPAVAAQVFVARAPMATPTGRYLGMVHFQRLLREPPSEMLGAIIDTGIDPIEPGTGISEITRRMATYNLIALAVVNEAGRLLGAVTVDDLLDHLLPRDWRDRDHPDLLAGVLAAAGNAGAEAQSGAAGAGPRARPARPSADGHA